MDGGSAGVLRSEDWRWKGVAQEMRRLEDCLWTGVAQGALRSARPARLVA